MIVFVATPFWSFDKEVSERRTAIISKYCGQLLREGIMCTSPVVFGVTILKYTDLPGNFAFWDKLSFTTLAASDVLHVLMLPGWDESRGVSEEIKFALERKIPIKYFDVSEDRYGSPTFKENSRSIAIGNLIRKINHKKNNP